MSQLTSLQLDFEDLGTEEPWGLLATLTSLQHLSLNIRAGGDPSPLSALTSLTKLDLCSLSRESDIQVRFSFSSLQPLSTLQQLEELHLVLDACAATSLHGLGGLSRLTVLELKFLYEELSNLEGISPSVTDLTIRHVPSLRSLAGLEVCTGLEKLILENCRVSSLQPLRQLSSMERLEVSYCRLTSLEGLESTSLQALSLSHCALTHLSGVEHLSGLRSLEVESSKLTSLQALSTLGKGLQKLLVSGSGQVQEEVLELPHVQPTADVRIEWLSGNLREVVLADGVRRAVMHDG
jgi:Leucine-rich repeat (LRR) protein